MKIKEMEGAPLDDGEDETGNSLKGKGLPERR